MKPRAPGFRYRAQHYEFAGTVPHETRDGRTVRLHRLLTDCPDCGKTFAMFATTTAIRCRNLRRRCDDCAQPGVPVEVDRSARGKRKAAKRSGLKRARRRLAAPAVRRPAPCSWLEARAARAANEEAAFEAYKLALGMIE